MEEKTVCFRKVPEFVALTDGVSRREKNKGILKVLDGFLT